ncbi:hypothetical protein AB6A40_006701 [Gnathostoma spinigerum]|uniref:PDZ domain-containing protein n=1 Tax=Gnathostoma spinigerum TaxID=75299 RepID=A0ABD6ELB4_9BILA
MSSGEARQLLRDATSVITLVLGRSLKSFTPAVATPLEVYQSELVDPATFKFSPEMQEVIIEKVGRGAGFSLGGGVRSVFGDRPIVVKKVYEGGSAEKSGRLKAGDKIVAIDGIDISGMTYVEASKVLKARPDGPILLSIYSRVK